eukprot:7859955-Prorocentrum_lima.AAC.1
MLPGMQSHKSTLNRDSSFDAGGGMGNCSPRLWDDIYPPWSTLFSPCGDLQSRFCNPMFKDCSDLCRAQGFTSGNPEIQNWQLLSHL